MDQLKNILSMIQAQLTKLSVTQKLLIAALVMLIGMTMFLVSQYAGSPKLVALIPSGAPEHQQQATAFLDERSIPYTVAPDGRLMVTPDRKYVALAAMAKAQALPGDKRQMLSDLAKQQNIWMSKQQLDQQFTIALQNELANIIRNFPGITDANVFISAPEPKGLGSGFRKPVAQVAIFPAKGAGIDPATVNALADLVAGSVAGLDMRDVAVIDGTNRRSYRASSPDDFFASSYLEQAAKVEQRVQEKIAEHLRFMGDAIVSVNAIVDGAKRETQQRTFMDRGQGSVSMPVEETTSNETSTSSSRDGAEPGLGSNVGMEVSRAGAGGSGSNSSVESGTVKNDVRIGERTVKQLDPRGRPTKINVTVSVPREYVAQVVKQRKGAAPGADQAAAAEPTEEEIKQAWDGDAGVKSKIEEMIAPLVETDGGVGIPGPAGGTQLVAGTVRAFLIPVAMAGMPGSSGGLGGGRTGAGTGGGMGGIAGFLDGGILKPILLGGLALLAMGLMVMMVKKAGRAPALPTAEELVGVPPALQSGDNVVGEADEGATAMTGIEVDEDSLKTSKMIDEVSTLVKNNPTQAAQVFGRWLNQDE